MSAHALIVEDRPEVAQIWQRALENLGMTVKWASTLAGAKQLSKEIPPPDLILLDLGLTDSPSKDTVEAIDELKQGNPNVVVLILSGLLTPELVASALAKGAHVAIEKLEIQQQQDLWNAILVAKEKASSEGQNALKSTSELIKKLTSALHFL